MDPALLWEPWVEEDVRHAALHTAFHARAFGGMISFVQLCGVLRDLGMMHELVGEETEGFLHAELLQSQLKAEGDLVLPREDEQHLTWDDVETLFNGTVDFQSCKDEDGRPLDAAEKMARFPRVNRVVDPETGATALFEAVEAGDIEPVETLLGYGADPDRPRNDGTTALFLSCQRGWAEMVRVLVHAGADPHMACNRMGATPFYIACHKGHIAVIDEL
eukprot:1426279-Prymnesium_polylepis.2